MNNEQMELGFNGLKIANGTGRRERRISRATWWFTQMRTLVEQATDWKPAPEPRPEQTWLPGARREVTI